MNDILITCLINLLSKDEEAFNHSLRLGSMAKVMARHLNFNEDQIQKMFIGCCLHDYGKIGIPEEILHKESALTSKEWSTMKRHPLIGYHSLQLVGITDKGIMDIVKYHHERIDGKGYPYGLKGVDIPIMSKICSILDAYDSMVSNRVYRKALTKQQAKDELLKQSGTQFDDYYVREFLSLPSAVQEMVVTTDL